MSRCCLGRLRETGSDLTLHLGGWWLWCVSCQELHLWRELLGLSWTSHATRRTPRARHFGDEKRLSELSLPFRTPPWTVLYVHLLNWTDRTAYWKLALFDCWVSWGHTFISNILDATLSCPEHVCAGEPPLEVHCGHAARVGTAVAPACWHVVRTRTYTHQSLSDTAFLRLTSIFYFILWPFLCKIVL